MMNLGEGIIVLSVPFLLLHLLLPFEKQSSPLLELNGTTRVHDLDEEIMEEEPIVIPHKTLKQVIRESCKQIDLGAAILPKPLEEDEDYSEILKEEFTAIVVEHHLKWTPLCHAQPGPLPDESPTNRLGRYDFYHADKLVDWAIDNDLKVKGHVLAWHVTTPDFVENFTAVELKKQLRRHIFTVMGHFRGRIQTWDVVNEALAPNGTLANNVFLRKLGPSYIDDCFHWAHEADPTATLLYNDNKVEGVGTRKSDAFYNLLKGLKERRVPVHGCGMQAHLNAAGTGPSRPPTPYRVKQQIARLGRLGLTVNLSELDVRVSQFPRDDKNVELRRQVAQRELYHDIVAAALTEPAFDGVWLWGFTDKHTWVSHFYYQDEPLIYDAEYGRKESYYGLRDALETMTVGGTVGGGVPLDSDFYPDGRPWGHEWMMPKTKEEEEEELLREKGEDANQGSREIEGECADARPDWLQAST